MANGITFAGAFTGRKSTTTTTTRTRDDIVTSLTNLDTKSDAWGKVIPMGFGRHRVAGALVWASNFYKTTESFDDTTTTQSKITFQQLSVPQDSPSGRINQTIINTANDLILSSGSQVTHGSISTNFIHLCYSFGTEGDTRKQRYIEKIRVNDTLIYDVSADPPYIADGIGFSIRYGYDNAPPSALASYPNGKFTYKGQTLVIFDKFPLASFGNSVPSSVDVEWGCCVGDDEPDVPDSGWPIKFWVAEQGSVYLETPRKLDISADTTQPGGSGGLNLNPAYSVGPDVYVTGIAFVNGTADPAFAPDLTAVKVADGISTVVGGAPNGSLWKFNKLMTQAAFVAYQQSGGIPFLLGNGVDRYQVSKDGSENYFEENTVSYSIKAYSSGKPNIKIADRLISDTVDTGRTVSVQSYAGKGRTLYVSDVFYLNRGAGSIGVTLKRSDGTSFPNFWNGGFTNGRAGGSIAEFYGRGYGAKYNFGAPGEIYTYDHDPNDTGIAATINQYAYFKNIYASE